MVRSVAVMSVQMKRQLSISVIYTEDAGDMSTSLFEMADFVQCWQLRSIVSSPITTLNHPNSIKTAKASNLHQITKDKMLDKYAIVHKEC